MRPGFERSMRIKSNGDLLWRWGFMFLSSLNSVT